LIKFHISDGIGQWIKPCVRVVALCSPDSVTDFEQPLVGYVNTIEISLVTAGLLNS
jgi:hypothetical protein